MEFVDKIQTFIQALDQKRFYQYCAVFIGAIFICTVLLLFRTYRVISHLKQEIEQTNELRQETLGLLKKAQEIRSDQKKIDTILAQEPHFKIAAYFDDVVNRLGLARNKLLTASDRSTPEGKYQEESLQAKFTGITMKELTELLQEIDQKDRVFTKDLDITKAKSHTINVILTIATLEPKQEVDRAAE